MSEQENNPCNTVGSSSVGESGASSLLTYTVGHGDSKLIVIRETSSSLCPNTDAYGLLIVNDQLAAAGKLTGAGGPVQAEAASGAQVVAIVHTVPNFKDIMCIRLGDFYFDLEACDLVGATSGTTTTYATVIEPKSIISQDWYAWNNQMPPKPDAFHIEGEVEVLNPGVHAELVYRHPQGSNPKHIQLELILTQRPGIWPQVLTWKQVRYDRIQETADYEQAEIFYCGELIETVPVKTVS